MTEVKTVRAAEGRRIVAPDGSSVPQKFQINPADPYWARMLREGDLELVEEDDGSKTVSTSAPNTAAVPVAQKKDATS